MMSRSQPCPVAGRPARRLPMGRGGAGGESLRYAMLAIVPFGGVAIAFLLRAMKHGRAIVAT